MSYGYEYKRALTIQDISCVGQCSMTVALPILSACGVEACPLPSAVLSTHTGGFKDFTVRDLTDDIPGIAAHWKKEDIAFDAIYTGYLGSEKQIGYVAEIMRTMGKPGCVKICDPAMADNGKLYYGFDDAYAKSMAKLCAQADYVLPNISEVCFMCGLEYKTEYDEAYIDSLLDALTAAGIKNTILTGVGYKSDETGVVVYENGVKRYYKHRKISKSSHGTGDIYASAFTGAFLRGHDAYESAKIAADYTVLCIENTLDDDSHWYGVKFETALPSLMNALGE